jgi:YihY family inner membrane protein
MRVVDRAKRAADDFQRSHRATAFGYGVLKGSREDQAAQQAALLAYYGFFSLFPLLLFAVTVLGIVLHGDPELQQRVLHSALAQFPIIGDPLRHNVAALSRSGVALAIGLIGALWAGFGVIKAMQSAMNMIWDVPLKRIPRAPKQIVKAALMLAVLGASVMASTGLSGVGAGSHGRHLALRLIALPVSVSLDVGVFLIAFKVLTVADLSWADVAPGAVTGGIAWAALQAIGSFYVARTLEDASALYGSFGIVIGLLSWMYLTARVTLLSAELNVVRKHRLWPRSLTGDNLTDGDRRALRRHARYEERVPQEEVEASFSGRRFA